MIVKILIALSYGTTNLFHNNITENHNNKHLLLDDNIDIKIEANLYKQVSPSFSAPAVAVIMLDYYFQFDKVSEYYVAKQMKTDIGHWGTTIHDFYQFLKIQINNQKIQYNLRWIPRHFGAIQESITYFMKQINQDLIHKTLPVVCINGYIPGVAMVTNQFMIINGVQGNLQQPLNATFSFLNTVKDTSQINGVFSGQQLALLWMHGAGAFFGWEPIINET